MDSFNGKKSIDEFRGSKLKHVCLFIYIVYYLYIKAFSSLIYIINLGFSRIFLCFSKYVHKILVFLFIIIRSYLKHRLCVLIRLRGSWEALMIDRKCFNRPDGSAMGQYTKSYLISGERPSAYALFAYWTHLTPVTSCYIVLLLCSSSVVGEGEQRKYKTV